MLFWALFCVKMKRFLFLVFGLLFSWFFVTSAQAAVCLPGVTPQLQITELYPLPKVFPAPINQPIFHEYIEIYNAGSCDLNLDGWEISNGTTDYPFPAEFLLPQGAYHALRRSDTLIELTDTGTQTITIKDSTGALNTTFTRANDALEGRSCLASNDDCNGKPNLKLQGDFNGNGIIDHEDSAYDTDEDKVNNSLESQSDQDDDGLSDIFDPDNDLDGDDLPNMRTPTLPGDNDPLTELTVPTITTPSQTVSCHPSITIKGTHEIGTHVHITLDGERYWHNLPVDTSTGFWSITWSNLKEGSNIFQAQGVFEGELSNKFSQKVNIFFETQCPTAGKHVIRASGSKRDEFVGTNHFWTEDETKAFAEKTNQGVAPKVLSYVNRNGYVVFNGYLHGRLPLSAHDDKRLQNEFKYRPYRRRIVKDEVIRSEYFERKDYYHHNHILSQKPKKEIVLPKGFKKLRAGDEFRPQLARRTYKKYYKNIFARRPMQALDRAESRINKKDMNTVRMRIGGRSVPMAAYLERRRRNQK